MPMRLQACSRRSPSVAVDERVEDDAGLLFEFLDDPIELLRRAHHGMHVLDGAALGVLRRGGAGDVEQSLAGRVRNQVDVEEALAAFHVVIPEVRPSPALACGRILHKSPDGGHGGWTFHDDPESINNATMPPVESGMRVGRLRDYGDRQDSLWITTGISSDSEIMVIPKRL